MPARKIAVWSQRNQTGAKFPGVAVSAARERKRQIYERQMNGEGSDLRT